MRSEARDYLAFERDAWDRGLKLVAGVDEAGRGPLAGPVVAAAVVFRAGHVPGGIRDSKELSPKRRQEVFPRICEEATAVGLGIISEKVIDRINILRATQLAMRRALSGLNLKPHLSLIDGMRVPGINWLQRAIVDGDRLSVSIAAASIIAKVTRDRIMVEQDRLYPRYGFASHKGYGTRAHVAALKKYGPCKIHRFSFRPVREADLKKQNTRNYKDK